MKVSGMKWLWLAAAMVGTAACSGATETQVTTANATAPDRVQSMLGGEGDDFWNDLCDTDEETGNTTCTLSDGNGTECGITYDVEGVVTEQGCEGPWGSYQCTAGDYFLTCDLAMGGFPACTESFDLESLELVESSCNFDELFPERPEEGDEDGRPDHGPGHGPGHGPDEGPGHGPDAGEDDDEDAWGDDEEDFDFACFEACEDLAMEVEEECSNAERPRECFEANHEEVQACFDACHEEARPDHGDDWGHPDHGDDEWGHPEHGDDDWGDEDWGDDDWSEEEDECDEPGFGPGPQDECFRGCEDMIDAVEDECRNAENPRECFETRGVDIEACFEACYQEERPDHGDDWGHPEDGGEWGHPEDGDIPYPEHPEDEGEWDFPEPDFTCVEGCEDLARTLEEACYLEERPRRCLREARREINACFDGCVELDAPGHGDEWGHPEDGEDHPRPEHPEDGEDFPMPEYPEHGDDGEWTDGPDMGEPGMPQERCEDLEDGNVSCVFEDAFMKCETVFNPETAHVYVDSCLSHDGQFGHNCIFSEETENMTCEHIAEGETVCTEEFGAEGLVSTDCEREDFPGEF